VPYKRSESPVEYVQHVIAALNSSAAQQAAFAAALPDNDQAAVSTVTSLPDLDGRPVANFAIARVTMQGPSESAYNVRVFFRLFTVPSTGTAFNPGTLYRSTPLATPNAPNPAGSPADTVTSPNYNAPQSAFQPGYPWLTKVPLLGLGGPNVPGTDFVTFPFFAVERVTPDRAMYEQPPDWPNTQTINIPSGTTGPVYAFFGCWLDINQADVPRFPAAVRADKHADGPFTASVQPPASIASLIRGQHQSLVAEIAYDEITIAPGATPGTSDRLAQRNLWRDLSDGPGRPGSGWPSTPKSTNRISRYDWICMHNRRAPRAGRRPQVRPRTGNVFLQAPIPAEPSPCIRFLTPYAAALLRENTPAVSRSLGIAPCAHARNGTPFGQSRRHDAHRREPRR
jgi:hypothetical protein